MTYDIQSTVEAYIKAGEELNQSMDQDRLKEVRRERKLDRQTILAWMQTADVDRLVLQDTFITRHIRRRYAKRDAAVSTTEFLRVSRRGMAALPL